MPADGEIEGDVLVRNIFGFLPRSSGACRRCYRLQSPDHALNGPAQVHCGRARAAEQFRDRLQAGVGSIGGHRQRNAVSGSRSDQGRTAHLHRTDRVGDFVLVG